MLIGDRIKELRTKLKLSQGELGDRVDTDSTIISRWETNRVRPSQKYIVRLANALGTSTDYLLGETNDPVMPKNVLVSESASDNDKEHRQTEKRLIIKNRDMYVDLPETSEGFEILRRFFDMQAVKSAVPQTTVMAM